MLHDHAVHRSHTRDLYQTEQPRHDLTIFSGTGMYVFGIDVRKETIGHCVKYVTVRINFLPEVSTAQAAGEALIEMAGGLDES